jgi:acetyl esterase
VPLDPEAEVVMTALSRAYPDIGGEATDVDEIRAVLAALPAPDVPVAEVGRVEDRAIPLREGREAGVRIYWPGGTGDTLPPVVAYFHGGGWVIGDLASHDPLCRNLCSLTGAVVVSVDYERAPENPFPGQVEDAYAATCWVAGNAAGLGGDPSRVAVAGDSSGGNLAAVVALMARDRGGPELKYQLLIYPVTDADFTTRSYVDNGDGYFLTDRRMRWYWDQYVPDHADRSNPYASPLQAADLSGLPPAYVVSAEYDPLRDEVEAYAERLDEAGNDVTLRRFDGMFHGFFTFSHILPPSQAAGEMVYAVVRDALRS